MCGVGWQREKEKGEKWEKGLLYILVNINHHKSIWLPLLLWICCLLNYDLIVEITCAVLWCGLCCLKI